MRLKQTLLNLTKAELSALRNVYELKNISNLKKAELVERMVEMLPKRVPVMLGRIGQEAYDILRIMVSGDQSDTPLDLDDDGLNALADHGLVFLIERDDGATGLYVPDEWVNAFRAADGESLRETVRRNTEWAALTQGMLHYYGMLDVERIRQHLEKFTGQPVPFMELFRVLAFACAYHGRMKQTPYGFCDIDVLEEESLHREHASRPAVPYRHFTRKQLMAASVPDFPDRTPEMMQFLDFIRQHYKMEREGSRSFALDVQDAMRDGASIPVLMQVVQQWIVFPSESFLNDFLRRLMTLYNATRQWALKGHAPNELFDEDRRHMLPLPDSKPLNPENVPFVKRPMGGEISSPGGARPTEKNGAVLPFPGVMKPPASSGEVRVFPETVKPASSADVKIGRNDPCPCGSGKKYKKCCMGKDGGHEPS